MFRTILLNYFSHKETINNFFWRILQVFGRQGISFFILILCGILLTPYEFGLYNYILAIIFLFVIFSDFGISTSISKKVSELKILDEQKLKNLTFSSIIIVLPIAFFITIIISIVTYLFLSEHFFLILLVLPMIFLVPITAIYDGIYRGLKKFKRLTTITLTISIFFLFAVYFLIINYGLFGALISQTLLYFFSAIIFFIDYKNINLVIDEELIKEILKYSILVGFANIGYFLYTKVDIIMLGQLNFIEEIGYYAIINSIFAICLLIFSTLGIVIAPNNIKYNLENKKKFLIKNLKKISIFTFITGVLLSIILYLLMPILINFFLPQYYSHSFFLIFYFFLFIIPLSVLEAVIANGFITPLGYINILTKTILVGGVLNIILNFILLYYLGYIGVIISTVLVHNFINFLKIYLFWNKYIS